MTIAMLNIDSPFAAVAADQLAIGELWDVRIPEEVERARILHPKVEAHATLPLVWVSAGMGLFTATNEPRTVSDVIRTACAEPFEKPLNEAVVPRLAEVIAPLVVAELESGTYDDYGSPDDPKLWILLGVADRRGAGGALMRFGRTVEVRAATRVILPSAHSRSYIESLNVDQQFPPQGSTPSQIVRFMRQVLADAIRAAQDLAGDNADVGGKVDVAVAGPTGARVDLG